MDELFRVMYIMAMVVGLTALAYYWIRRFFVFLILGGGSMEDRHYSS